MELTSDQLRTVTALAGLAPSVHNTQPWRLRARGHTIELHAQPERGLAVLDPTNRQLHISCGAAVEFARLAIRSLGYECVVRLRPRTDVEPGTLLATLTVGHALAVSAAEQRLVDAIPRRYTDRGPYDDTPVPTVVLSRLADVATERGCWLRLVDRPGDRAVAIALLAEAEQAEQADPRYWEELAAWTHPGTTPDGIPDNATAWPDSGRVSDLPLRAFHRTATASPTQAVPPRVEHDTLVLLGSDEEGPLGWLRTGRALGLLQLCVTEAGLASQPLGPVTDLPATRNQLRRDLGLLGYPQLLLRVGYGHGRPRTGRRDVEDVLERAGAA